MVSVVSSSEEGNFIAITDLTGMACPVTARLLSIRLKDKQLNFLEQPGAHNTPLLSDLVRT